MAVAYIRGDRRWLRRVAAAVPDHPKIRREFLRAADRSSLEVSLTADQVRVLAARLPDDDRVVAAMIRLEAAEESDRRRTEALHALTDRWREEASWRDADA